MSQGRLLSRCAGKIKPIFLVATVLMEIYDVIIDIMEAYDYQAGKLLHLSKPRPQAAKAFIVLASIGAIFSLVKIIFVIIYHWKVKHAAKVEWHSEHFQEELCTDTESKEELERHFANINLAIKSLTLIFEDVAQAVLPYWFITRCSVDFDSIVKICFICVCPILNFAYFTFIAVRIVWRYKGKHKSKLRVFLVFLLAINVIPFAFGVLSSKVAFDRTHLIGDVPKIVLVQQKVNGTAFGAENNPEVLKEKNLYAVWRIIERADSHCANISFKCKNGSFFANKIFNGCSEVRFILCYKSALLNIVYKIQICQGYPTNCTDVKINKTGLYLRYTSDFCGENKANQEEWGDVASIYSLSIN